MDNNNKDSDFQNANLFYELVGKINPLPQDLRQAEIAALSSKIDRKETENIMPEIAAFQDASSEIQKISQSLSKKSEIEEKIKELNEKTPKVSQFFQSNEKLFDEMNELKMKKDFCKSLSLFTTIPNEILIEVQNKNYQLATRYLISMMSFLLNPKYDFPLINSIKQQFSNDYISKLLPQVEFDMYLRIDDQQVVQQSVLALGFYISFLYFNIAELNNPSPSNDDETIKKSILEVLNTYFTSWTSTLLTEKAEEIFDKYMKAGETLSLIDSVFQDYILKFPFLNLPENNQRDNKKIKPNDIFSLLRKYCLTIYTKYVNFSHFNGYFYEKRPTFTIEIITQFDVQSKFNKTNRDRWGKLVPRVMSISNLILLNGILDLMDKCKNKDLDSVNIFDLLRIFDKLSALFKDIEKRKDFPDFNFLKKLFENYHSNFAFYPFNEQALKLQLRTFVHFCLLFKDHQSTVEISEIIYRNFSVRIVSALTDKIINSSLNSVSLDEHLSAIEIILKNVYIDSADSMQTKEYKTFFDDMQAEIRKSKFNLRSILDLFFYQVLNGITDSYRLGFYNDPQLDRIEGQQMKVAEWYLDFLKIDRNKAKKIIEPYSILLRSYANKET